MKPYEEKKEDLQSFCSAFKQLDENGKLIVIGTMSCMLAKKKLDESDNLLRQGARRIQCGVENAKN